jgi:tRNA (guanosine-2'-O-)-methyltransferase
LNKDLEDELDQIASRVLTEKEAIFFSLPPQERENAISILESYINEERRLKIRQVLKSRTKHSMFLYENPINPSNVWACLRTIDSFGIQNIDVIINSKEYLGKQALNSKRGMRTAMGSAKWLSLKNHASTQEAVVDIRDKRGYKIFASDLNPNSKDIRDLNWDSGPICVVMGNEDRGITDEMRALADETFTLPMVGFAESFNLSVATAITLAHMSAKSKHGCGPLRPGNLTEDETRCLYLKGLMNSLPQWKQGQAILKQKGGIILPDTFKML